MSAAVLPTQASSSVPNLFQQATTRLIPPHSLEENDVSKEDFLRVYSEEKQSGLLADGGDTNIDVRVARLRNFAFWIATEGQVTDKKGLYRVILEEAKKINDDVNREIEKNVENGRNEHPGFPIPDEVIKDVKAFSEGSGELSTKFYDWDADDSKWIERDVPNFTSDTAGITNDRPHLEDGSVDPMDVDSGPAFVAEICEQNNATQLLEAMLANPRDRASADRLSDAINDPIKNAQEQRNDEQDLLLPLGQVRSFFMCYVNLAYLTTRLENANVENLTDEGKQKVADSKAQTSDQKDSLRQWWDTIVYSKGYPSSWKASFVRIGDEKAQLAKGAPTEPFSDLDFTQPFTDHRGDTIFSKVQHENILALADEFAATVTVPQVPSPSSGIATSQGSLPANQHLQGNGSSAQSQSYPAPRTVSSVTPPAAVQSVLPGSVVRSDFPGCVKVASDPGYIVDSGQRRKVEGWKKTGRGNSLLVRMNPENQAPAICDLIAAGPFGPGKLKETQDHLPRANGATDIAPFKGKTTDQFNCKVIAVQRGTASQIVVLGYFDKDDRLHSFTRTQLRDIFYKEVADAWIDSVLGNVRTVETMNDKNVGGNDISTDTANNISSEESESPSQLNDMIEAAMSAGLPSGTIEKLLNAYIRAKST